MAVFLCQDIKNLIQQIIFILPYSFGLIFISYKNQIRKQKTGKSYTLTFKNNYDFFQPYNQSFLSLNKS